VPFEAEFMGMAESGVKTVLCYERPPNGWTGESGFITAEMVRRYLAPSEVGRPFIVAGPPVMVTAMERVLDELRVPAADRLVEHFGPRPMPGRTGESVPATG
jgi:NAD(P)H-flavin reductase